MIKKINYRNVLWHGHRENVVDLLRATLANRPNADDTTVQIGDEHIQVRHRDVTADTIKLHFSTFVPGARKGTTPHNNQGAPQADLSECGPPPHEDFNEREFVVVVRRNYLAFIGHGFVRDSFVEIVIRRLVSEEHGVELAIRFYLSAEADPNKVEQMMQSGVDFLDLGVMLPHVEAAAQVEAQPGSIARDLGRTIKDVLSARLMADHDGEKIEQLSKAKARLTLQFGKNSPLEEIESLTTIARDAVEHDSDFKVYTRDGGWFSQDKLVIAGEYKQRGRSATISYLPAWQAIVDFLDDQ